MNRCCMSIIKQDVTCSKLHDTWGVALNTNINRVIRYACSLFRKRKYCKQSLSPAKAMLANNINDHSDKTQLTVYNILIFLFLSKENNSTTIRFSSCVYLDSLLFNVVFSNNFFPLSRYLLFCSSPYGILLPVWLNLLWEAKRKFHKLPTMIIHRNE